MRLHRWMVALASRLVPKDTRADWRQEWDGELTHRETTLNRWSPPRQRDLVRRSAGAFWDALWMRSSRWRSLRLFVRHWRLTSAAIVSLGTAIAATTVGVSAYNALLLRPAGVPQAESLNTIYTRTSSEAYAAVSVPEYDDYATRTHAFSGVAAFQYGISWNTLKDDDRSEQILSTQVSANFFDVLAIPALIGHLTLNESNPEGLAEIAIGERFWRTLGQDPNVLGRTLKLNDHPVIVAGVVPASFRGLLWGFNPDVWMTFKAAALIYGGSPAQLTDRTNRWLTMAGRRQPGVTLDQAAAEAMLVAASIAREHPKSNADRTAVLTPLMLTPANSRPWASMILGALMLVVVLTLVVASANVTNLLLGLSGARRHEMLVRAALGASRAQLALPLVKESAALGLIAGALGSAIAWLGLRALAATTIAVGGFLPPVTLDLRPDIFVLTVTMGISLAAGIIMGLAPALRGAADGLSGHIHRELAVSAPHKSRARHILVVLQMAVATVVLVGLGLAIHSLVNLRDAPLGFSARHLVFAGVDMRRSGLDNTTGPAFYDQMISTLVQTKGLDAVALADNPPLLGYSSDHVLATGEQPGPDGHGASTPYAIVNDTYFSTLGIELLRGRTFDSRDRSGAAEVIVVNATLARQHWPGKDPVGQILRIENGNRAVTVVGVVPDGKYGDIDEGPLAFMYFHLAQHYQPDVTVIARSSGERDAVATALLNMRPGLVLGGIGMLTLDDVLEMSLLLPRMIVWTAMAFGLVAVVLATFGLYSTVFYAVSQRRMEMGIRTTLGATPGDLFRLALRESGRVALIGAAIGLVAGLALLPVASSIFFGIGRVEPAVLGGVSLTSAAMALVTTYLVVRPWTKLSPSVLLRS